MVSEIIAPSERYFERTLAASFGGVVVGSVAKAVTEPTRMHSPDSAFEGNFFIL